MILIKNNNGNKIEIYSDDFTLITMVIIEYHMNPRTA